MSTKLHPTAEVHDSAKIGDGVMVWNWTNVREGARIGAGISVGQWAYIDFDFRVGERCKIQNGVSVYAGVTLGDEVFVGPNATFINDLLPRAHGEELQQVATSVNTGASIGANATIVCGATLHEYCMVAAGVVVTADVPAYALVMGCPARVVDYVTRAGKRRHVGPNNGDA